MGNIFYDYLTEEPLAGLAIKTESPYVDENKTFYAGLPAAYPSNKLTASRRLRASARKIS
jgi:hypothetical protein